jgi:hypothetical protein
MVLAGSPTAKGPRVGKKTRKQRIAEQLGMSIGAATSRLRKNIVWKLLLRTGENRCFVCGDWIKDPEDFAIGHIEEWADDPDLFWNYDNIAFGHPDCLAERDAKRQEESKMSLVKVIIENQEGRWLPATIHKGQLYVAGKLGERYNIRLRNLTNKRIEVVTTVDGRDVVSGEVGSKGNRGYIINENDDCLIKGFRQTDENVAAFRFGDKKDSYSQQMGTGASVGVIGVAVFKEKEWPWRMRFDSNREGTSTHPQYEVIRNFASGGDVVITAGTGSDGNLGDAIFYENCAHVTSQARGGEKVFGCTFDSSSERQTSGDLTLDSSDKTSKRSRKRVQKLGTEYGETVKSVVQHTYFTRNSTTPDQVVTIEYDTKENLQKRGIIVKGSPKSGPDPFPKDKEVSPGYAKPPPRRNYK